MGRGWHEFEGKRNQTDWHLERSTVRTAVVWGRARSHGQKLRVSQNGHGHRRCRVTQRLRQDQMFIRLPRQPRHQVVSRPRTRLARNESKELAENWRE